MSYAVMLFKELFASQLSVPSSPAHPTICTTVLMKIYQTKKKKATDDYNRQKEQHKACISQIAPCIHSSHNDPFLFWNRLFFEFAKNVYLLIED